METKEAIDLSTLLVSIIVFAVSLGFSISARRTAQRAENIAKEQAGTAKEQAETAKEQAETAKEQAETAKEQAEAARHQVQEARHQNDTALRTLKTTAQIADGNFLLNLESLWARHWETHLIFRSGEGWIDGVGPSTPEEWANVENYMGVFERINRLLKEGLITVEDVVRFYGYRLRYIWKNKAVRDEKLVRLRFGWEDFVEISQKVAEEQPGFFREMQEYISSTYEEAQAQGGLDWPTTTIADTVAVWSRLPGST